MIKNIYRYNHDLSKLGSLSGGRSARAPLINGWLPAADIIKRLHLSVVKGIAKNIAD